MPRPKTDAAFGTAAAAQARYDQIAPLARQIRAALRAEIDRLGFDLGSVPIGDPSAADYRLDRDPASGQHRLIGEWRDFQGQPQGKLVFHPDGSFYVEHDVIRTHPQDARWFVEAVHAWGRGADIRAEPRLLAGPD
ncbi:hypothetical protein [uncultured Thiodictyon sp.]|jgi:hypothetical protein|uniref:hypothetical protein n=1 Tax=uncultured Thiodictyon sp. TaxID=1846217 RepID=UPI0025E2AE00|nr:hypothetical protein [uncultured Thiodictyon sp.]